MREHTIFEGGGKAHLLSGKNKWAFFLSLLLYKNRNYEKYKNL